MKNVNYQGLIILIIVKINSVHTLSAGIKENVTGLLGENGTQIECSYTKENVFRIDSVAFLAFNKSTTTFDTITTYLPDTKTLINTKGQYLEGRVTLKNITQSSTMAVMIFNKLLCIDDTLYRCYVRYLDSDSVGQDATSNTKSISVQVPPSKPDDILVMHTPEDSTVTTTKSVEYNTSSPSTEYTPNDHETVSTLESVTMNDTAAFSFSTTTTGHNITSSTPSVNDISSKSSYRTTTYSSQTTTTTTTHGIVEGDNITVVCTGDVGKPPAKHFFQKYRDEDTIPVNFTASSTSISEMSDSCSCYRTSNLTIQVKAEDNNAVIRCVVNSSMEGQHMYVETSPIEVYYAVRMPTIIAYPNKTNYVLGEDTSIHLTCKSDGNPKPYYYWYKESPNEQLSSDENFTLTDMNITDSGTYFCKVNNTFIGGPYEKAANVQVKIIHEADKSTPSSSGSTSQPADSDGKNTNWIENIDNRFVIGIIGFVVVVIAIIAVYYFCKRRKKENIKSVDKMGSDINLIESQKTASGEPSTYSTIKNDAYEDIDLENTDIKVYSISKEQTPAEVTKHNEDYLKKQKEDEDKEKENPTTPPAAVVYYFVNKPKNTTETKTPSDQKEEDVYEESKEGLYDTSGDRRHKVPNTAEHYDTTENIKKEESDNGDLSSAQKGQIGSLANKSFKNDSELKKEEKRQVATVSPIVQTSFESKGDGQTNNINKQNCKNVKPEDQAGLIEVVPVFPTEQSSLESQGEGQTNKSNDIQPMNNYQNVNSEDQTGLTKEVPVSRTERSSLESQGEGQKNKSNDNCNNVKSDAQTGLTELASSYPTDRSSLESEGEGQTNKSNDNCNNIKPDDQTGLTEVAPSSPTDRSSLESQGEGQTNKSIDNCNNVKPGDQTGLTELTLCSPTDRSSLESEGEGQTNKSNDSCNNIEPDDQTGLTEVAPSSPTDRSSLESQGEGQTNKSNNIQPMKIYQNVSTEDQTSFNGEHTT